MKHLKILKKIIIIIFLTLFFTNNLFSMSEEYEKKLYWGCYPSSKQYLGSDKAKLYCSCTVKTLSEKFTDDEMDSILKKSGDEQLKTFNFAAEFCGNLIE